MVKYGLLGILILLSGGQLWFYLTPPEAASVSLLSNIKPIPPKVSTVNEPSLIKRQHKGVEAKYAAHVDAAFANEERKPLTIEVNYQNWLSSQQANYQTLAIEALSDAQIQAADEILLHCDIAKLATDEVMLDLVSALGGMSHPMAVEQLLNIYRLGSISVRKEAVEAIAEVGGGDAVWALSETISDDDTSVRRATLYALDELDNQDTTGILALAAQDELGQIRALAHSAMSRKSH